MISRLLHLVRPVLATTLMGALLFLGFGNTAWAISSQHPVSQTIPIASPTISSGGGDHGGNNPISTATPASSGGGDHGGGNNPASTATPAAEGAATPEGPPASHQATASPAETTVPVSLGAGPGGCSNTNGESDPGTVVVADRPVPSLPPQQPPYVYVRACDVTYTDGSGTTVPNFGFSTPVEVCLTYTDADLARAGYNPANMVVITYDPQTGKPVELPYTIDPANKKICGKLTRAGAIVLAIRAQRAANLPNTGGDNSLLWGSAALLAAMLCGLGVALRFIPSRGVRDTH